MLVSEIRYDESTLVEIQDYLVDPISIDEFQSVVEIEGMEYMFFYPREGQKMALVPTNRNTLLTLTAKEWDGELCRRIITTGEISPERSRDPEQA